MTEPKPTPATTQDSTTAAGDQSKGQPGVEERLRELEAQKAEAEAKRQEAVREMNEKQRLAAELQQRLASEETLRLNAQAQLAAFQTKADPLTEMEDKINQLEQAGETAEARRLTRQVEQARSANAVQSVAAVGLLNTINQTLMRPDLTPEAKAIIREKVFEGGDPKKNFRTDKFQELLALSIKPGAWDELIEQAKEQSEGRKVLSGKTKEQLFQEWTAEQEKRKKEAEAQSSLTQPGAGGPNIQLPQEKVKQLEQKLITDIIGARNPA